MKVILRRWLRLRMNVRIAIALAAFAPLAVALADCYYADKNNGYCGPDGSGGGTDIGSPCTITNCAVKWGCQSGYQYLNCWTTPDTDSCTVTAGVVEYTFWPVGWYCLPMGPGPSTPGYPCTTQYTVGC